MKKVSVDLLPNPAILLKSLRNTGYDNYRAMLDLIDNSVDAQATRVIAGQMQRSGKHEIYVADNGRGMSELALCEAIRIGSDTDHDPEVTLGKFGMGLVTASTSIGKHVIVMSKEKEGPLLKIEMDLDDMYASNSFTYNLTKEVEESDKELFKTFLSKSTSGTVVLIRKCDKLSNKTSTDFNNILRKDVGRVHRNFISSGKVAVWIGPVDKLAEAKPIDPLEWDDPDVRRICDETVTLKNDEGVEGSIRIRLSRIADRDLRPARSLEATQKNQGVYLVRNNRELGNAGWLGIRAQHNVLNYVRGEVSFTGKFDGLVNTSVNKSLTDFNGLDTSVKDKIKDVIQGFLSALKKQEENELKASTPAEVESVRKTYLETVKKNSNLMRLPETPREKRSTGAGAPRSGGGYEPSRTRGVGEKIQWSPSGPLPKFSEARLGLRGAMFAWDPEKEGRVLSIKVNVDHPFYLKMVSGGPSTVKLFELFIYSMCVEEFRLADERLDFDSVRSNYSHNLSVMLGNN